MSNDTVDRDRIIALRNEALERRLRGEIGEAHLHRILDENPVPRVERDESLAERVTASGLMRLNGGLERLNQWLREKQQ